MSRDRVRLDWLVTVLEATPAREGKKLLRAAQMEDQEQGLQYVTLLDETGNVIVLGNVVVLRSEQEKRTDGVREEESSHRFESRIDSPTRTAVGAGVPCGSKQSFKKRSATAISLPSELPATAAIAPAMATNTLPVHFSSGHQQNLLSKGSISAGSPQNKTSSSGLTISISKDGSLMTGEYK
ncbi:hypothetical protein F3Y22_tig00110718pilonHSYRG00039 [Hibiscus syriacus]|uniref:Uncharacterized protein n=1 Tax=Hibiscus syriacus TaxID=106335 RepID=A0A6A2ZVQ6_HIBSY|nr:hypothetical protein F3Y22_tig00110718pilonHSYRG00039 [Hibiscus syriacus]